MDSKSSLQTSDTNSAVAKTVVEIGEGIIIIAERGVGLRRVHAGAYATCFVMHT